jgi:hypothetical protein
MLLRAGYDIAFECPAQTSMLLQVNIHPSREPDLCSPDIVKADPTLPMSGYLDLFGNRTHASRSSARPCHILESFCDP